MNIGKLQGGIAGYGSFEKEVRPVLDAGNELNVQGVARMNRPNESEKSGDKNNDGKNGQDSEGRFDKNECHSCKNRTYQDGSDDPGVSFKAPTKISADQSATAVMGHEMEHVNRNQAKAKSEGREVISQSVTLQNAICGECGDVYVAGGETRTVTGERKSNNEESADKQRFEVGLEKPEEKSGQQLDAVA